MSTNLYQTLTDRILRQLDAGTLPWRKTWASGLPKSLITRREYRGLNLLLLGLSAHTSKYWLTYRQAQRLGGHVRQGERATPIIFWKWRTPEELARRRRETGRPDLAPCHPFTSAVFNLDQVEGVPRPADDVPFSRAERLVIAEKLIEVMPDPPAIVHSATAEPSYRPALDQVTLPHLSQFEHADHYFATLAHEVVHASGARKRLNRFGEVQGDRFERYGFEELVAEFGAAFLCGFAGIANPEHDQLQASYLAGWATALRREPQLLIRAASAAQRAADYIRGKVIPEANDDDTADPTDPTEASPDETADQPAGHPQAQATTAMG